MFFLQTRFRFGTYFKLISNAQKKKGYFSPSRVRTPPPSEKTPLMTATHTLFSLIRNLFFQLFYFRKGKR